MSQPATANAPLRAITARWLVPLDRPPLAHGVLWVRGGRIVGIEPRRALQPVEDLGEVAIVPGLINAHTHLELSPHAQPIGPPGISFSQWLTQVIAWRRQWLDASDPHAMAARRQAALQAGLAELTAGGTVAVGEIAYPGFPEEVYQACPLAGRLFLELLGVEAAQVPQQMALARRHLTRWTARGGSLRGGLSPHAPYSVHPELLQQAVALAAEADVPVAMHLAESPEEIELLASGRGPLAEVLQMRGVCPGEYLPAAVRPLDYLKTLSRAPQALVIHGNYLGPPEIAFLADHRQRMTVVYCPRTHAHFGHAPYPLASLLAAGVRVAVGTDSRATNPDLNLWRELVHIAQHHPAVPPETILAMGTRLGAEALGLADELGSLAPGKRAVWTAIPLARGVPDLWEALFDGGLPQRPLPPDTATN
jgi:cytosine/adenosine deaminase-related metal-dependent hydrolase